MDEFTAAMMSFSGDVEVHGRNVRQVAQLCSPCVVASASCFLLPVGLPMTVYENVALAPRLAGDEEDKAEARRASSNAH